MPVGYPIDLAMENEVTALFVLGLLLVGQSVSGSLSVDHYGFLSAGSQRRPEQVAECVRDAMEKAGATVHVSSEKKLFRLSDRSGFMLEIGPSISGPGTLLRIPTIKMGEPVPYAESISSCL